ncbi:MAG: flavodoxin family protein [Candidatus Thermoplasmatota archaeon]|nr:flavodoxin family protein [Candidatus Thermoplasmatota archaeon]
MKIGIVYYSRTGNTRQVAKTLEEKFKEKNAEVDLIEIEHVKRPGFFTAGRASMNQQELSIKNTDFDMQKYDVMIVGTPTWAGRPSPFMKVFINKAENIKGKKVAVFGTGMSPLDKREQFKEIMKNNLENVGIKTVENYLLINFKRGQIVDGEQNIDDFVNTVLKL